MTWLPDATLAHLRQVADQPDLSGTRYRLRQRIGQGGMGIVYLAEDTRLGRTVALKVLSDPLPDATASARLQREARVLARLEHPGIVPVHDAGILPDGRTFYTMKWVQGNCLDQLAGQGLPLAQSLGIFERVCEAVAFAHAHGVVHRDLKPENVMVGAFGEVLVMDWGVAKVLRESTILGDSTVLGESTDEPPVARHPAAPGPELAEARALGPNLDGTPEGTLEGTLEGTILGTPGYMAPEQARGDIAAQDRRADVYSLGALLHFLLTGHPPGTEMPRGTYPKRLRAIVRRALRTQPTERYDTASDLVAEIARFRAGEAVEAYRENLWDRLGRFYQRYRVALLLVLAYLLMRVVLFWVAGY
jgi:serine/threonine protein kinase